MGSGDCARAVPDVFWMAADGLAMVKEEAVHLGETRRFEEDDDAPAGFTAWARVPPALEQAVELAAANCPGTCISVDHEEPLPLPDPEPEPEPEVEPEVVVDPGPAPAPSPVSFVGRVRRRLRRLMS